ncbi:MAG: carboxy terminal-processing peptidase [Schleiferiaceae bacterium]
MKRNLKYTLPALLLVAGAAFGFRYVQSANTEKESLIMRLVAEALQGVHYQPREINDAFSEDVFTAYLDLLDGEKRFFYQSDYDRLAKHRQKLDDYFLSGDLTFFETSSALWNQRRAEARRRYTRLLAKPLDYSRVRTLETDAEKRAYPKDSAAMDAFWADYLTSRVLDRLYDRAYEKKDSVNAAFLPGHADFAANEAEARTKELEIHNEWFDGLESLERADDFGYYLNAYAAAFDPHTSYFPPQQQEAFEIEMTGQLEGIGAQLQQDGEFVTIASIVTGSACWRQGELEVGDKLLKVAQGSAEPEDVVGMRVNKVVTKVRGKKGTEVRLTVRKKDGTEKVIPIVRDIVEMEATFARSALLGDGIGYIRLPKFYVDFFDESNRDCAEDVRNELRALKAAGARGIIFDLRGNGGGSLPAAVGIAGHFIDQGPVVQVKTQGQRVRSYDDPAPGVEWDGPLVVLVDESTASASEIVAAALQDYGRAIIVGTRQTFGKGTVQNMMDFDRAAGPFYSKYQPLGAFKLTIQKYYRVNGGTTQLDGVRSDVVIPDAFQHVAYGERELDFALAADRIPAAKFRAVEASPKQAAAIAAAQARVNANPEFIRINEYSNYLSAQEKLTGLPLNWEHFVADRQADEAALKRFDREGPRTDTTVAVMITPGKPEKAEEDRRWLRALRRDPTVVESMRLLTDLQ